MSFPALKNAKVFQPQSSYQSNPYAQEYSGNAGNYVAAKPMSFDSTITKSAIAFTILLAGAALGWFIPGLMLPAVLAGLVLGLVISFKQVTNPAAILSYSGLQGVVIGGISGVLEAMYPGIVTQAVLATLSVFVTILVLAKAKIFRTSPKLNRIFMVAALGYLLFGLVNLGLMLFGVTEGMFGLYSDLGGLGIIIGVLGVALASYSLVGDFEYIEQGIENQAEAKYEWFGVFGLIASLVWLYIEILRLLAIFRQ